MKAYKFQETFIKAANRSDAKGKFATTFGRGIRLNEIKLCHGSECRRKTQAN